MNIGIVTAVWNGYGEFVDQWLESIERLDPKPSEVTIALGENHGLPSIVAMQAKYPNLPLTFISTHVDPLMGPMRNAAVAATNTEWIMYLSVDDVILPQAIEEFEKYQAEADYICIKWLSVATWRRDAALIEHDPKTPEEMARNYQGRGFIVGHSPFRKRFWEKHPYVDHDYPNAPFVAEMVESGARFAKTERPCTIYLKRLDSHAARLGRRLSAVDPVEKAEAIKWKLDMQNRILKYYGVK